MVFVLTAHNAVVRLCLFHSFCYANLKEIFFLLYNGHWIVYCNGIINYVATRRLDSIIILVCLLFLLLRQTKNNTRPRSIEVLSHLWGECSTPFTLSMLSQHNHVRAQQCCKLKSRTNLFRILYSDSMAIWRIHFSWFASVQQSVQ